MLLDQMVLVKKETSVQVISFNVQTLPLDIRKFFDDDTPLEKDGRHLSSREQGIFGSRLATLGSFKLKDLGCEFQKNNAHAITIIVSNCLANQSSDKLSLSASQDVNHKANYLKAVYMAMVNPLAHLLGPGVRLSEKVLEVILQEMKYPSEN
ncbi:hypothetical protein WISP_49404 [Willisornis vidua]|uniref:Uncharacterized protein n=1 Tax=Willisornis vidua TaxID=1566151 RepID=A0ABQ9DJZ0_9PASS|nr:hypothetical protein WISP_49404 [Willisornis vidua]